jgi:hypothetical protein
MKAESTNPRERAKQGESTGLDERVTTVERTIPRERVRVYESIKVSERVTSRGACRRG